MYLYFERRLFYILSLTINARTQRNNSLCVFNNPYESLTLMPKKTSSFRECTNEGKITSKETITHRIN